MAAKPENKYINGWIPDRPDFRDLRWVAHLSTQPTVIPPDHVDLSTTSFEPPIWNQGEIGSCTAHGIGYLLMFGQARKSIELVMPSRLFIYYNERVILGTIRSDSGASIRDGIKSVAKKGYAKEDLWPYDISKFTKRPPVAAFKDARNRVAIQYVSVAQDLDALKYALAEQLPVVFGFSCFSSLESPQVKATGMVPLPTDRESSLGGHCVALVGYDDKTRLFKFRNSWDSSWGDNGYGYMSYDYVLHPKLAGDFWIIRDLS